MLEDNGACEDGIARFKSRFPKGGDYQKILYLAVLDNCEDYARWLLEKFGPLDTELHINKKTRAILPQHIYFAGKIIITEDFKFTGDIVAGRGIISKGGIETLGDLGAGSLGICSNRGISARSIDTGGAIKCEGRLKSSSWIRAGSGISAGLGIFAGDGITSLNGNIHSGGGIRTWSSLYARRGKIIANNEIQAYSVTAKGDISGRGGIQSQTFIRTSGEILTGKNVGIYAGSSILRNN